MSDATGPRSGADPAEERPRLSVVVLQWDNLELTRACVASLRRHTDVGHELIIVDNGSAPDAVAYARAAADVAVCHDENLGFSAGMNAGLDVARGEFVVFVNNDTEFPPSWASRLLQTASTHRAGIVVPSVTQAGNQRTVRTEPVDDVEVLAPFLAIPAGVVVLMPTDVCRALGGYGADEFPVASGEDLDLAFKVWTNDLEVVHDQRVLVEHVGHATADRLEDRATLWRTNRETFHQKWLDPATPVPRLSDVSEARHAHNRRVAAEAVALRKAWMDAALELRDARRDLRRQRRALEDCREQLAAARPAVGTSATLARRVGQRLPTPVTRALLPLVRRWRSARRRGRRTGQ